MKQILLFITLSCVLLAKPFSASISPITPNIKKRMTASNSWRVGCPVGLKDLRYIQVTHHNFKGSTSTGEIILHKEASLSAVTIFEEFYEIGYPIRQMRLVSDFKGNDWQSIEAGNTSAFNCRPATGTKNGPTTPTEKP